MIVFAAPGAIFGNRQIVTTIGIVRLSQSLALISLDAAFDCRKRSIVVRDGPKAHLVDVVAVLNAS